MSELPSRWAEASMGDLLINIEAGRSFKCSDRPAGPDEWGVIKVSAMTWREFDEGENKAVLRDHKIDPRFEIQSGDLLFSRANTVNYVGAVVQVGKTRPRLLLSDKSLRLVPHQNVSRGWLLYYLRTPPARRYLESLATGTSDSMRNISQASLRGLPVPLAPRREQRRIVAAIEEQFSRLDAGVAALERAQRKIKRMLLSLTAMADISNLRQGWEQVSLADVADIDSGPAFPSAMFKGPGEGIRLLRGDNIEPGALRWTNTRTWPLDMMQGFEHLHVCAGDLILAMDRPVIAGGLKLACVNADDLPALLVQRVARISPASNINSRFLHIALMSPRFVPHLLRSQTGTQLPHITLAGIRSFPLVMPPQDVQVQVAQEFDSLSAQILDAQKVASVATKRGMLLRKAILAAAFSGKLVPQDPEDEPASALLKRITVERASGNDRSSARTRKRRVLREEVTR